MRGVTDCITQEPYDLFRVFPLRLSIFYWEHRKVVATVYSLESANPKYLFYLIFTERVILLLKTDSYLLTH